MKIEDEIQAMFDEYSENIGSEDTRGMSITYDWSEIIRIYAKFAEDEEKAASMGQ